MTRLPACEDRSQSETVGVILLVAVVVVLIAGAGAVVIANWQSDAEREAQINIQSELTNETLTVKHMGGDSLPPEDVLVILEDADWERTLDNESAFSGTADRFGAGSSWEYVGGSLNLEGEVTLRVFDTSTNTQLHQQTYDV